MKTLPSVSFEDAAKADLEIINKHLLRTIARALDCLNCELQQPGWNPDAMREAAQILSQAR